LRHAQKSYGVNTKVKPKNRFKIGWYSISIRQSDENHIMRTVKENRSDFN